MSGNQARMSGNQARMTEDGGVEFPRLRHTVLDTTDPVGLAEFYRELLGLRYRSPDESPTDGTPDTADWVVLVDDGGARQLAFQRVESLERTTWPEPDVPMQMHIDFQVSTLEALHVHRKRAEALGAEPLLDRTDDPADTFFVLADPAGHPFCICVV
jgi:catechol 2,3-dioxygenase-like lactoylglutathione lyase family enzyme